MPVLYFHTPRRRATSPRLFTARKQAGEGGKHHEMLLLLDVGYDFLLQQCRERLLIIRVHLRGRANKSPNTLRARWAHNRRYTSPALSKRRKSFPDGGGEVASAKPLLLSGGEWPI